jgi:hypothetical protein
MPRYAFWIMLAALAAHGCSSDTPNTAADQSVIPGIGDGEEPGSAHGAAAESGGKSSVATSAPTTTTAASPAPSTPAMTSAPAAARPAASSAPGPASGATPGSAPTDASPSAAPAASSAATPVIGTATSAGAPASPSGSAASESKSSDKPSEAGHNTAPAPGTLTAGTWDDNRNFDRFTKYRESLKRDQISGVLPSTDDEHKAAHDEFAKTSSARQTLDIALMIDTTGSMGDELSYLQSEFLALSKAIEEKYPNSQQRWALVAYRDTSDEYVTRWFDFRDDANDFRDKLGMQSAGGGGDFPEAPDAALAALTQLAWRTTSDTARLAFWVADAPHHSDKAQAMLDAIRDTHDLGVHLYPVASSGVDDLTERTMREAAQLTGGRYLFLTDDSGVGLAHKEPSIPCYFVTHLDRAILRMVDIEVTGKYSEPASDDVIRTTGSPKDGTCQLESGEQVSVF